VAVSEAAADEVAAPADKISGLIVSKTQNFAPTSRPRRPPKVTMFFKKLRIEIEIVSIDARFARFN
jgi:hypothetical protein